MPEPLIYEALAFRGNQAGDTSATFTRWPDSPTEPLALGDVVTFTHQLRAEEWRVTRIRPHDDGSETYDLEPYPGT